MHPFDVILLVFYAAWVCSWFTPYRFSLNSVMFKTLILGGLWFSPTITAELHIPRWMFWTLSVMFLWGIVRGLRHSETVWELFAGIEEEEIEIVSDEDLIPSKDLRDDSSV